MKKPRLVGRDFLLETTGASAGCLFYYKSYVDSSKLWHRSTGDVNDAPAIY